MGTTKSHTVIKFKTKKTGFDDYAKIYGSGSVAEYETLDQDSAKAWHLVSITGDGESTVCGQVYSDYDYSKKEKIKGGITCKDCLSTVLAYKSINI